MSTNEQDMKRVEAALTRAEDPLRFSDKYSKLHREAKSKMSAMHNAGTESDKAVIEPLRARIEKAEKKLGRIGELKDGEYILNDGASTARAKAFNKIEAAYTKASGDLKDFLSGEKVEGIGEKASEGLKKAAADFDTAASRVTRPAKGYFGILTTHKDGFAAALRHNGEKMKFWSENLEGVLPRAKSFAHGASVVGSVIGVGDAIFRSKDSEGEDRSGAARVAEAVIAGSVGTAALLSGRAIAR